MRLSPSVLTKTLITTLLLLVVFTINPLGIRTSAEKHNEDHIIRMLSPYFAKSVSTEITVILLDDAFLNQTKRFPVSYSNLARILKVIGLHDPSSVFFDILQHHKHSEKLDKWLTRINKSDFPVFLASNPKFDSPSVLNSPETLRHQLSQVAQFSAVSWDGHQHYYPFSTSAHGTSYDTVASSLYKVWCVNKPTKCAYDINDPDGFSNLFSDPMIVQWGNQFDPRQTELLHMGDKCIKPENGPFSQLMNIVFNLLGQGVTDDDELDNQLRSRCPPVTTVSATMLFDGAAVKSELLKSLIHNKTVLIGYDLTGGVDLVSSPVHGKIAGVFMHAVALDNMIRSGDDYWHVPPPVGFFKLSIADILEIGVQTIVLFFVVWYRYTHIEHTSSNPLTNGRKQMYSGLLPLFIVLSLVIVSILISQLSFKVGIANWYALPLILILDLPIFLYYLLEAIKQRILRIRNQTLDKAKIRLQTGLNKKNKRTLAE